MMFTIASIILMCLLHKNTSEWTVNWSLVRGLCWLFMFQMGEIQKQRYETDVDRDNTFTILGDDYETVAAIASYIK